jgi:hypothetical protein
MGDESKMMIELLKEIRDRLDLSSSASTSIGYRGPVADPAPPWWSRGPVADPAPPWWWRGSIGDPVPPLQMRTQYPEAALDAVAAKRYAAIERIPNVAGPVADPGPELLLDKTRLAKLKIVRLDQTVASLEKQIEAIRLERDLLAEEYKLK